MIWHEWLKSFPSNQFNILSHTPSKENAFTSTAFLFEKLFERKVYTERAMEIEIEMEIEMGRETQRERQREINTDTGTEKRQTQTQRHRQKQSQRQR